MRGGIGPRAASGGPGGEIVVVVVVVVPVWPRPTRKLTPRGPAGHYSREFHTRKQSRRSGDTGAVSWLLSSNGDNGAGSLVLSSNLARGC